MTIFSRLFGKRPAVATVHEQPAVVEAPVIDRALFIEEAAPEPRRSREETLTILEELKSRDYERMGKEDGYEFKDFSRMDLQLELIAADFREAYDKELAKVSYQLSELEAVLEERLRETIPGIYRELETKYKSLKAKERELLLQKDLAVTGEGYVERAMKYYRAGFEAGLGVRLKGDLMFKHISVV
ncbi:hypothetical protein QWZ00_00695 [Belliella kenyensis]|nr:hypothetical protein [Belliella kenyensis]MDN3601637.1 hypothetical protein [Belliella kenyensis]